MGKWNYRRTWRPKNYYRDQRIPSPPTYYDTEFKLRGEWKNAELPWEERFCISVGISWERVVNAKKYMHCYDNVVKWNDSAGESAFSEAKKRFWAKINDIPADVPWPDPDMYNKEIDWDPKIDPDLVKELDLAYFNPDEAEKLESYNAKKRNDGFGPGCILGLNNNNTWRNNENVGSNKKMQGWDCSNNSESKNISDPWERGIAQDDKEINDTWGGDGSSSWKKDVTWGDAGRNSGNNDISWGGGANNSWHWNQFNNQAPSRQRGDYRGSSFGRGQWRGQHDVGNSQGGQRHNGSGWGSNISCRKREGEHYTRNYKNARIQYDDYREVNRHRW
uniref:uncharacterized protein LOC122597950 n=1 Tax=Erigeron canadensis TaxID=72917 RepID=UPI001CB8A960|nr:uncharacterized protein LOC122597950 [Erigeron canadensis]